MKCSQRFYSKTCWACWAPPYCIDLSIILTLTVKLSLIKTEAVIMWQSETWNSLPRLVARTAISATFARCPDQSRLTSLRTMSLSNRTFSLQTIHAISSLKIGIHSPAQLNYNRMQWALPNRKATWKSTTWKLSNRKKVLLPSTTPSKLGNFRKRQMTSLTTTLMQTAPPLIPPQTHQNDNKRERHFWRFARLTLFKLALSKTV